MRRCAQCGNDLTGRHNATKFCLDCKAERSRANSRRQWREQSHIPAGERAEKAARPRLDYAAHATPPIRCCIVCGTEITPGHGAYTCSTLCRDEAYRAKRRRKEKRLRRRASRQAKQRRRIARERAVRQADPAWQAWKAGIAECKRGAAERKEQRRLDRLDRQRQPPQECTPLPHVNCRICGSEFMSHWKVCCSNACSQKNKKILSRRWHDKTDPEYKRELWAKQRYSKRHRPGFYLQDRERRRRAKDKEARTIRELLELGWIDGNLDVIVPDAPRVFLPVLHSGEPPPRAFNYRLNRALAHERLRRRAAIKPALRGQIICVDRFGVARKVVVDTVAYKWGWSERYELDRKMLTKRIARALRREQIRRRADAKWPVLRGQIVIVDSAGVAEIKTVDPVEYLRGYAYRWRYGIGTEHPRAAYRSVRTAEAAEIRASWRWDRELQSLPADHDFFLRPYHQMPFASLELPPPPQKAERVQRRAVKLPKTRAPKWRPTSADKERRDFRAQLRRSQKRALVAALDQIAPDPLDYAEISGGDLGPGQPAE
jgi:predicted nucleic acid-binding Zn ribbon protein